MQNRRGFTLIELTVVLLIISFVVSGGMVTFTAYVKKSQSDITIARMDEIEKALINYGTSFGRLPCPASLTLTKSSLNTALYGAFAAGTYGIYGVEAENSGSCTGGTNIASNFASASGVVEGAVPVRALGLPDAYIYDGWGHRFRYAVDPDFTSGTQSPPRGTILPMPTGGYCNPSVKTITIKDSQGAAKTTSAIYALISHGQNGHGGYNASGAITNAGSANTDEQKNCHCNSSAASTANDAIYVQKALTNDTSNAANSFDDIVAFKEAWQIQNGTSTAITPDCIYVVDNINHIYKYLLNARTWSEVLPSVDPNFATPAGATTILSVATNSNGDLFTVASRGAASNLRKYSNSTGTWNNSFDVSSPTTGSSISLDSLGNSYIVNASSILVYNSAGTFLAPNTMNSADSAANQLETSFDASNNFFIADYTKNRISRCNKADTCYGAGGAWTAKYGSLDGSAGTTPGKFNTPKGVYVDIANNLWVADTYNNRIQKCSLINDCTVSSNWVVWGGVAAGTDNGRFNNPSYITGDALGNIWVADTGNARIVTYSKGLWSVFANYRTDASVPFSAPTKIITGR